MTGSPGHVVGVGDAAAVAVRFGERTGRPVHVVGDLDDPSALREDAGSTFLMVAEDRLDHAAVDSLTERSVMRRHPVGFLPLTAPEMEAADLVVALADKADPDALVHRSVLYCDFLTTVADRHPDVFGRPDSSGFLALARDGLDATVVHSHGNGADLRIGADVLCLRVGDRSGLARPSENALPCQSGGACRLRHKTTFSAFHGPGALRVRLLVLISCAGFHPYGGMLDGRFQFALAMLRGPHTAGIITSTRITFTSPDFARAALNSVRVGQSLGVIALRMNGQARFGPPSYVCLGDPELRTAGPQPVVRAWTPPAQAGDRRGLLFAADALDVGAWPDPGDLADRLRAAALSRRDLGEFAEPVARAASRGALGISVPAWVAQFRPVGEAPGPACPACGRLTCLLAYESLLYREYRRLLTHCPRHGVLADRPLGWPQPAVLNGPLTGVSPHAVVARHLTGGGRVAVAVDGDVAVWLVPGARHG